MPVKELGRLKRENARLLGHNVDLIARVSVEKALVSDLRERLRRYKMRWVDDASSPCGVPLGRMWCVRVRACVRRLRRP